MVFEGLDTYADVYLNDALVLKADNMFRTWRVDCKRVLKPGDNILRVRFRSPINEVLPVMAKMKYQLPAPTIRVNRPARTLARRLTSMVGIGGRALSPAAFGGPCLWRRGTRRASAICRLLPKRSTADAASLTSNVEVAASAHRSQRSSFSNNLTNHTVAARKEITLSARHQPHLGSTSPFPTRSSGGPTVWALIRFTFQGTAADRTAGRSIRNAHAPACVPWNSASSRMNPARVSLL